MKKVYKIDMVFNSSCMGGQQLTPEGYRDFEKLEAIRDATSGNLKLLVNEACLYQCPFRYAHFNFFSHANGPGPKPN